MSDPSFHGPIVYGIANCDTVKKARAWLDAHGVAYRFYDFKKQGLPQERLSGWMEAVGWERLVNRRGTTWRRLDPVVQSRLVSESAARTLMEDQVSLIKRPVVEWPQSDVSVGFDPEDWARRIRG